MTVPASEEPSTIHAVAKNIYLVYGQKVALRLLDFADTTTSNEIKILKALNKTADAYRFHGFSQAIKELCETSDLPVPEAAVLMEKNKAQEARTAALELIQLLRSLGFTTNDLNDISDSLKTHNENARLFGQTEALLEFEK